MTLFAIAPFAVTILTTSNASGNGVASADRRHVYDRRVRSLETLIGSTSCSIAATGRQGTAGTRTVRERSVRNRSRRETVSRFESGVSSKAFGRENANGVFPTESLLKKSSSSKGQIDFAAAAAESRQNTNRCNGLRLSLAAKTLCTTRWNAVRSLWKAVHKPVCFPHGDRHATDSNEFVHRFCTGFQHVMHSEKCRGFDSGRGHNVAAAAWFSRYGGGCELFRLLQR